MVGSSPSEQQLQSVSGSLRAVIIPFAGVPPDTRSLLLADPSLSHIEAYSLHHNADSTAEMAIALLFAASKNILPADAMLRKNDWSARGLPNDGTPDGMPLMLLRGKSALVLGLGQVGNRVSSVLRALGVRVKATRASCKRVCCLGFRV
jgi:phosphoglycerate dehydrogenase-like enzyme